MINLKRLWKLSAGWCAQFVNLKMIANHLAGKFFTSQSVDLKMTVNHLAGKCFTSQFEIRMTASQANDTLSGTTSNSVFVNYLLLPPFVKLLHYPPPPPPFMLFFITYFFIMRLPLCGCEQHCKSSWGWLWWTHLGWVVNEVVCNSIRMAGGLTWVGLWTRLSLTASGWLVDSPGQGCEVVNEVVCNSVMAGGLTWVGLWTRLSVTVWWLVDSPGWGSEQGCL